MIKVHGMDVINSSLYYTCNYFSRMWKNFYKRNWSVKIVRRLSCDIIKSKFVIEIKY